MDDVLLLTLAILLQKCFFSTQTLLKIGGHALTIKIDKARMIRQTWSTGLTSRLNQSDRFIWKQNQIRDLEIF
jgi:hypothetical protein